jgi:hypothetical protein
MIPLPYILASGVACLIIAGGVVFCIRARRSVVAAFRRRLRDIEAAGELPPELEGVDLDTVTPDGFGVEVSARQVFALTLAAFLAKFWFAWPAVVIVLCLGVAALLRSWP